jgi:hypothetical protein
LDYLEKLRDKSFQELTKRIRFNIDYFKNTASDGLFNLNFGIFDKYLDNFDNEVNWTLYDFKGWWILKDFFIKSFLGNIITWRVDQKKLKGGLLTKQFQQLYI